MATIQYTNAEMLNYYKALLIETIKNDMNNCEDIKQTHDFIHDILNKRYTKECTIKQFIKSHKHTTERFDYILANDIQRLEPTNKQSLIDYLLANGWVADKNLGEKRTLRGYKLKH